MIDRNLIVLVPLDSWLAKELTTRSLTMDCIKKDTRSMREKRNNPKYRLVEVSMYKWSLLFWVNYSYDASGNQASEVSE